MGKWEIDKIGCEEPSSMGPTARHIAFRVNVATTRPPFRRIGDSRCCITVDINSSSQQIS